jgi:peroxiredoxin
VSRTNPILKFAGAALAAIALTFIALSGAPALAKPEVGKPAPEFKAVDANGKVWTLAELRGKTVVLEWTNDGCPYVQKHYNTGNMQALQKAAAADGVIWLSVISSAEGQQGHVDGKGANKLTESRGAAPAAVILDPNGEMGRVFSAEVTPHMYIINAEGVLAFMGGIDDKPAASPDSVKGAKNYVTLALAEIKAGKPVSEPVTRAYGCTIKYKQQSSS